MELAWLVGQDDTTAWTGPNSKLKEGIFRNFGTYVTARAEG